MTKAEQIRELLGKGLTYREIAEKVNSTPDYVSTVVYRLKKKQKKVEKPKEENPVHEVQIERERIRREIAEKKYLQLKRLLARDENIVYALRKVIPQFPVPEKVEPPRPVIRKTKETAVLLVSDWQGRLSPKRKPSA